ncbi:hypothetical protein KY386_03120 [Candidatus Parcubacteria bacterium]|nr:hypothetical protein [Candidatus Parcubacteria bacterium]
MKRFVVTSVVSLFLLAGMSSAAYATKHSPAGNNGTVKVDGVEFDQHPDNQPHVGCVFQIDFYNFDKGDNLFAKVTFRAQAPTGKKDVLLTNRVFIGEDAATGGTDLDAEATYDLSSQLAAFAPHAKQGYHVKLTVNAAGSKGKDTKHKTFWIDKCQTTGGPVGGGDLPTVTVPPVESAPAGQGGQAAQAVPAATELPETGPSPAVAMAALLTLGLESLKHAKRRLIRN